MSENEACENTDREIYREPDKTGNGSYYSDSIHVTKDGGIGINCGGHVIVKPLKDWFALAAPVRYQLHGELAEREIERLRAEIDPLQ